ncbi:MAG: hypothetical protein H0X17_16400 [Deltaproteobacteria bacterium]|nr:hypothetical protein [Deltaproteobacteria bacterium]
MKRREPLPDLGHVLEDSRPHRRGTPAVPLHTGSEQRIHTRFDKAFVVVIGSELYGDSNAIARNVSAGGILVEMTYAPPLGTVVTVHFQHIRGEDQLDEMVVRAEVKHHHYLNFTGSGEAASTRAIGMRFLEFVDPGERIDPKCLH